MEINLSSARSESHCEIISLLLHVGFTLQRSFKQTRTLIDSGKSKLLLGGREQQQNLSIKSWMSEKQHPSNLSVTQSWPVVGCCTGDKVSAEGPQKLHSAQTSSYIVWWIQCVQICRAGQQRWIYELVNFTLFHHLDVEISRTLNGWVVPTSRTRQKMKPIRQKQRNPGVLNQREAHKTGGSHRLTDDIRPHQGQVAEMLTILAHSWAGPTERKGNQIGKEGKETRQTTNNIKTL